MVVASGRSSAAPDSIGVDEARERARVMLASIRNGSGEGAAVLPDTPFETVADEVFRRYARNWKPSTLKVNQGYYCKTNPALVPGTPDCRHRRPGRQAMVRVPPQYPGGGGPIRTHPLRHHAPGRSLRATGRRAPTLARASSDTGGRGGSASCRRWRYAGLARCWQTARPIILRQWRSYGCCCSRDAVRARSSP